MKRETRQHQRPKRDGNLSKPEPARSPSGALTNRTGSGALDTQRYAGNQAVQRRITPGQPPRPSAETGSAGSNGVDRLDRAAPRAAGFGASSASAPGTVSEARRQTEITREAIGDREIGRDAAAQAVTHSAVDTNGRELIVPDSLSDLRPGQVRKTEFVEALRNELLTTAEGALRGTGRTARGCPWIAHWLSRASREDGPYIERFIQRFTNTAGVESALDYLPLLNDRVVQGIARWQQRGARVAVNGLPVDVPELAELGRIEDQLKGRVGMAEVNSGPEFDSKPESSQPSTVAIRAKAGSGGFRRTQDPRAVLNQLGPGRSLDLGVRGYMQTAYGRDLSRVKIHTDAKASDLAREFNARAFTIGNNIVFAPGQYQPGTPAGDFLIAHELAHVVQQESGAGRGTAAQDLAESALEVDADRAAASALLPLSGMFRRMTGALGKIAGRVGPVMKSGLRLQRCPTTTTTTAAPPSREPIRIRKVTSGTLEGGKKVSDYWPTHVGTNAWGSDTTAGPFDNGVRAGSVVQLIGEIPSGVPHGEYTLTQMVTVARLRLDGTAHALEGQTLDDIARSGADQSTTPFRQVWGANVTFCDPISGAPYNTLTSYDFKADLVSGIQHSTGSPKTVNWGVVIKASSGTVTTNTVS